MGTATSRSAIHIFTAGALILAALSGTEKVYAENWWDKTYQPERAFLDEFDKSRQRFEKARDDAFERNGSISRYVQSGITMSDLACDAWLDMLGRSDRDASVFKDVVNIVGNLILGVSGINGASSNALARGTLGLSAINASVDAYRHEVILGSISDIQSKIKEGRIISAQTLTEHLPVDPEVAKRRLREYNDGCSPAAIKVLLRAGLAAVKYVPPDVTLGLNADALASMAAAKQLAGRMYASPDDPALLDGRIPDDVLYRLWATRVAMPGSEEPLLRNWAADPRVVAAAKALTAKDNGGDLTQLLEKIGFLRKYKEALALELNQSKLAIAEAEKKKAEEARASAGVSADQLQGAVRTLASTQGSLPASLPVSPVTEVASAAEVKAAAEVSKKPELELLKAYPELATRPVSALSAAELKTLTPLLGALAPASGTVNRLKGAVDELLQSEGKVDAAGVRAQQIERARPTVQLIPSSTPASISAVIVPVNPPPQR